MILTCASSSAAGKLNCPLPQGNGRQIVAPGNRVRESKEEGRSSCSRCSSLGSAFQRTPVSRRTGRFFCSLGRRLVIMIKIFCFTQNKPSCKRPVAHLDSSVPSTNIETALIVERGGGIQKRMKVPFPPLSCSAPLNIKIVEIFEQRQRLQASRSNICC